jgi:hypothetical protein
VNARSGRRRCRRHDTVGARVRPGAVRAAMRRRRAPRIARQRGDTTRIAGRSFAAQGSGSVCPWRSRMVAAASNSQATLAGFAVRLRGPFRARGDAAPASRDASYASAADRNSEPLSGRLPSRARPLLLPRDGDGRKILLPNSMFGGIAGASEEVTLRQILVTFERGRIARNRRYAPIIKQATPATPPIICVWGSSDNPPRYQPAATSTMPRRAMSIPRIPRITATPFG